MIRDHADLREAHSLRDPGAGKVRSTALPLGPHQAQAALLGGRERVLHQEPDGVGRDVRPLVLGQDDDDADLGAPHQPGGVDVGDDAGQLALLVLGRGRSRLVDDGEEEVGGIRERED